MTSIRHDSRDYHKVSVEMFRDTATGHMKVLMTNNEQHPLVSPRYVCQVTDRQNPAMPRYRQVQGQIAQTIKAGEGAVISVDITKDSQGEKIESDSLSIESCALIRK